MTVTYHVGAGEQVNVLGCYFKLDDNNRREERRFTIRTHPATGVGIMPPPNAAHVVWCSLDQRAVQVASEAPFSVTVAHLGGETVMRSIPTMGHQEPVVQAHLLAATLCSVQPQQRQGEFFAEADVVDRPVPARRRRSRCVIQ